METSLANIEQQLARLWETESGSTIIKACLFNLVVYTDEPHRTSSFEQIIRSIIEKFPCRIIFIQGDRNLKEDYLKVDVTTKVMGKGTSSVACEQIVIRVAGKSFDRVPYLILPHFVPDLPIYLLWGRDPTVEDKILPKLEKFACRLIFDSEGAGNLQRFSQRMLTKMPEWKMDLIDMNWVAICGWREALAKAFDTEERVSQLKESKEVIIFYNGSSNEDIEQNSIPALYLQAWLAAQMQWKWDKTEKSQKTHIIRYSNNEHPIVITLCPKKEDGIAPGTILEITILNEDGCHFEIKLREPPFQIVVHISTQERCFLPFTIPLRNMNKGKALMDEIFFQKNREHYVNMLHVLEVSTRTIS